MKKMYSKPEIMFESFAMSTNIASGCEVKTKNPVEGTLCGYKPDDRWTGDAIFETAGVLGCDSTPPTGMDAICYHVPDESYNLFSS